MPTFLSAPDKRQVVVNEESHVKGLANHKRPESCVGWSDPRGEALTGESVGCVLSREKGQFGMQTLFGKGKATTSTLSWQGALVYPRGRSPGSAWKQLAREPGDPATTQPARLVASRAKDVWDDEREQEVGQTA